MMLALLLALQNPYEAVGIEPMPEALLDRRIEVVDEEGRRVRWGDVLGRRPTVLAFIYYRCPMLCGEVLSGLVRTLKALSLDAGRAFDVVVLSIDPREPPTLAAAKKREVLRRYGRPGTEGGWHFLTASEASIAALTGAAGFRFRYDPRTDQYAHAGAILVLTPEGRISRLFSGIDYPPFDVKLALLEAADGKIGSLSDRVTLLCYRYDPSTGRYSLAVMGAVRAGGIAVVAGLAIFIWRVGRRGRGRT